MTTRAYMKILSTCNMNYRCHKTCTLYSRKIFSKQINSTKCFFYCFCEQNCNVVHAWQFTIKDLKFAQHQPTIYQFISAWKRLLSVGQIVSPFWTVITEMGKKIWIKITPDYFKMCRGCYSLFRVSYHFIWC